jgi:enterochelin esterase-like enzyme
VLSLTGGWFVAVVGALTVASFAAVVAFWNSLAGRSTARVAARVGMLLVVNVLVLFTAAIGLNDQYLFFASWADLHGALTGTIAKTQLNKGAHAAAAAQQAVPGKAARIPPHVPALPPGSVDAAGVGTFRVHGSASGITGTVVVRLPPGYLAAANANRRYPVLEAFSGYPGSPVEWVRVMNLPAAMAEQVRLGHMRPALIVEPQQWVPPGVDTECTNGARGNPQVETWLTVDVPRWVARTFRVATSRTSWATIGLSAGGYCAAMAGMLQPAQYGGVINMGGYFRPELGPYYLPYPPHSVLAARYDLVALARRAPPPLAMWMETSHVDAVSYRSSAAFLRATRAPLSVRAVVLQNAGHRIAVWQALLPESLQWLGAALPGFR